MEAKIIILFCIALLPPIIYGGSSEEGSEDGGDYGSDYGSDDVEYYSYQGEIELNDAQSKVDHIVDNNGTINNVFKPLEYIDRGCYGLVYRGELTRNGTTKMVAMKISPFYMLQKHTVNEYDYYTYLNAIDNPVVENYGIPAVYYYSVWENCTMLGITYLQSPVSNIINAPGFQLTDIDTFILFREYVRISKYIHSHGVCQVDIKLENLMFRKHQGFIIDFNTSNKINSNGCRKEDWKKFLTSMCFVYRILFDPVTPKNTFKRLAQLENPGLKKVFMRFAEYVFTDDSLDYDRMYAFITREIRERGFQEPVLVSWLNKDQHSQAYDEWVNNPTPDIRLIDNPPTNAQYTYPKPDYYHFLR